MPSSKPSTKTSPTPSLPPPAFSLHGANSVLAPPAFQDWWEHFANSSKLYPAFMQQAWLASCVAQVAGIDRETFLPKKDVSILFLGEEDDPLITLLRNNQNVTVRPCPTMADLQAAHQQFADEEEYDFVLAPESLQKLARKETKRYIARACDFLKAGGIFLATCDFGEGAHSMAKQILSADTLMDIALDPPRNCTPIGEPHWDDTIPGYFEFEGARYCFATLALRKNP